MIIFDTPDTNSQYWQALVTVEEGDGPAADLAKNVVEKRAAACAQVVQQDVASPWKPRVEKEHAGKVYFKTTTAKKGDLEHMLAGKATKWEPISGNAAYLDWLQKQCSSA